MLSPMRIRLLIAERWVSSASPSRLCHQGEKICAGMGADNECTRLGLMRTYIHTRFCNASSSTHAEETKTSPEQQDLFHYPRSPSQRSREFLQVHPPSEWGFCQKCAHTDNGTIFLFHVSTHISLKAFSHLGISAWLYCFRQVPGLPLKNIRGCSENVQCMWLTHVHANREILGRLLKCSMDRGTWGGCSKTMKSENYSL
jgi:hypothetical protein